MIEGRLFIPVDVQGSRGGKRLLPLSLLSSALWLWTLRW